MSFSYPLSMPETPKPVEADLYIERNQTVVEGFSRNKQVQRAPGDRWIGKITLPMMGKATAQDWLGFFDALDGFVGSFYLSHPDFTEVSGTARGTTGSVTGENQGSSVQTSGWSANQTGLFRRGDMIQVGETLKRIVEDADSDASGDATLKIMPVLYKKTSGDEDVVTENPQGIFRLSDGFVQPSSDLLGNHSFSFAVEEVLA